FDNRSFSINDEVNINVVDKLTARDFDVSYQDDLKNSTPYSLEDFRTRPFYVKLTDHFCGWFRALL
ncbi:MAG TPA: hypothetical protein VMM36_06350, partial [Opitutaceae bacterium]|nr:hypothetical protein [Opitutaceae bacterium]